MKSMSDPGQDFMKLLDESKGIIHKVAMMYTSNAADKDDLYQEICLQLWRSFKNYRNESKFSTWLYRVSLNTAISSLRNKSRFPPTIELDLDRHYAIRDTEYEDRTRYLMKAVSMLNRIDKGIILLWLEKRTYDEISEIIGITRSAVSVRIVRIKKKLEEFIKKLENE